MGIVTDRPRYRGSVKSARDFWSQPPGIVLDSDNVGCATDISVVNDEVYITEVQYDETVFKSLLALDGKTPNVPFHGDDDL